MVDLGRLRLGRGRIGGVDLGLGFRLSLGNGDRHDGPAQLAQVRWITANGADRNPAIPLATGRAGPLAVCPVPSA